jgi:hypothetical protein
MKKVLRNWWEVDAAGHRSLRFSNPIFLYGINAAFAALSFMLFMIIYFVVEYPGVYWEAAPQGANVPQWFSDRSILDVNCPTPMGGIVPARFIQNLSFSFSPKLDPLANLSNALHVRPDAWITLQLIRADAQLWPLELRAALDKFRPAPRVLPQGEYESFIREAVQSAYSRVTGRITLVELFVSSAQNMGMTYITKNLSILSELNVDNVLMNPNNYTLQPFFPSGTSLTVDDFFVMKYDIVPYDTYLSSNLKPMQCRVLRGATKSAVEFFRFLMSIGAFLSGLLLFFRLLIQLILFLSSETTIMSGKLPKASLASLDEIQPVSTTFIDPFQHESDNHYEVGVFFVSQVFTFISILVIVSTVGAALGHQKTTGATKSRPLLPSDLNAMGDPVCQCTAAGSGMPLSAIADPVVEPPEWCQGWSFDEAYRRRYGCSPTGGSGNGPCSIHNVAHGLFLDQVCANQAREAAQMRKTLRSISIGSAFAMKEGQLRESVEDLVDYELKRYNSMKLALDHRYIAWARLGWYYDSTGIGIEYNTEQDLGRLRNYTNGFAEFYPPSLRHRYDSFYRAVLGLSTVSLNYRGTSINYGAYVKICDPLVCVDMALEPRFRPGELTLMMMSLMTALYGVPIAAILKVIVKLLLKKELAERVGQLRVATFVSWMLLPAKLPQVRGPRTDEELEAEMEERRKNGEADSTIPEEGNPQPLTVSQTLGIRRTRLVRTGITAARLALALLICIPLWATLIPEMTRTLFRRSTLTYIPTTKTEYLDAVTLGLDPTKQLGLSCIIPPVAATPFITAVASSITGTVCTFSHGVWFGTNCNVGDVTCSGLRQFGWVVDNLCSSRLALTNTTTKLFGSRNMDDLQRPHAFYLPHVPFTAEWNASLVEDKKREFHLELFVPMQLIDILEVQVLAMTEWFLSFYLGSGSAAKLMNNIRRGLADPYNVSLNPSRASTYLPASYSLLNASGIPQSSWDSAVTVSMSSWTGVTPRTSCVYEKIEAATSTEGFSLVGGIFGGVSAFILLFTPCLVAGLSATATVVVKPADGDEKGAWAGDGGNMFPIQPETTTDLTRRPSKTVDVLTVDDV